MNFYIYNTINKINWSIESEKKIIGNFSVQKATTNVMGRKWVAWFCNDIPLPYGPYCFTGLPGLILEIYDDKLNYKFSFMKNINYKKNSECDKLVYDLTKNFSVNITENEFKKIQINYYNNPLSEYKNGDAYMTKDNGEQFTTNDYKELEIQIKKQIINNNNPIDLENKIDYEKLK